MKHDTWEYSCPRMYKSHPVNINIVNMWGYTTTGMHIQWYVRAYTVRTLLHQEYMYMYSWLHKLTWLITWSWTHLGVQSVNGWHDVRTWDEVLHSPCRIGRGSWNGQLFSWGARRLEHELQSELGQSEVITDWGWREVSHSKCTTGTFHVIIGAMKPSTRPLRKDKTLSHTIALRTDRPPNSRPADWWRRTGHNPMPRIQRRQRPMNVEHWVLWSMLTR